MAKKTVTLQSIFDRAWEHFVVNFSPLSVSSSGNRCLYRSPEGHKCAIGLVIDDNDYTPEIEGLHASKAFWVIGYQADVDGDTLDAAQCRLHDSLFCKSGEEDPRKRELAYREFAIDYNLKIPGE